MERRDLSSENAQNALRIIFAAELFSKLSEDQQVEIINQLKALLSRE